MGSVPTFNINSTVPVQHIISGSFRSLSLFLLAFSPLQRDLALVQKIGARGPHQYLAANARRDCVYATTWGQPPALSSWAIARPETAGGGWNVSFVNSVPIMRALALSDGKDAAATSSYINIPPPYTHEYSAGGPTGEVHVLDPATGAFGEKIQQILVVPEDELENADKGPAALTTGSHAVEFSKDGLAFIPVLGTDTIEMYSRDAAAGKLAHIASVPSPRGPGVHDAPRHVKVHPNGKILYCVTEHTNLVDAYTITPTTLTHLASRSLLPAHIDPGTTAFRGDTLVLAPTGRTLFATTRGGTVRGWLSAFSLNADGTFAPLSANGSEEYWETPTSGGKANALDVIPKGRGEGEGVWILLADDDEKTAGEAGGGVRVLEWEAPGRGVRVVAGWPKAGENVGELSMEGGSHAIWLD
ncbi:hypothetical protein H0H81_005042 [Sphagnurus paluster]|uniref:Isomerase YbhE n=1 Tax=Sphagnurus paluster TaxID=117069 RepID=A0A9P7FS50_9AGAR|nr:hypothetical protein H0H81_005042 [Sphagnurus paluster]